MVYSLTLVRNPIPTENAMFSILWNHAQNQMCVYVNIKTVILVGVTIHLEFQTTSVTKKN